MNDSDDNTTQPERSSKFSWDPEEVTVLKAGDEDYSEDDLVGDEDEGSEDDELEEELPESPGEQEDQ